MLQILLLIMKIIGIVLAVLLGLVFLLLFLVLFMPVRYRAYGVRNRAECRAEGKLSWLWNLVCVPVDFRDGRLSAKVKILGFTILNLLENEDEFPEAPDSFEKEKTTGGSRPEMRPEEEKQERDNDRQERSEAAKETVHQEEPYEQDESFWQEEADEQDESFWQEEPDEQEEGKQSPTAGFFRELRRYIRAVFRFFREIPRKLKNLKCTFLHFCDRIKRMIKKYRRMKAFALDEKTKAAVGVVWKQAGVLFRQAQPRVVRGELHFGTEDPALTGQILGAISIFYPLFKDNVKVNPDFEKEVLEGELFLKGRLRAVTVLRIAWRLYRDKNVRWLYRRLNR